MLIAANIVAGCGCSNMYSEKSIQSRGLKQMKKRYGNDVEFTIKFGGPGLGSYDMYLTVEGKEDWNVIITYFEEDRSFYDNYMSWVLREKVEAVYLPLIYQVYVDGKVYNSPYGGQQSNIYTKNTTIDEYLDTVIASAFNIFISSDSSDKQEKLNQLADLMKENGLNIDVTVLYVPEAMMEEISRDNHKDIISKGQYLMWAGYTKQKEKEGRFRDWREGKLK